MRSTELVFSTTYYRTMTCQKLSNPRSRLSMQPFTRLLAEYRARVYENHAQAISSPVAVRKESAKPIILVIDDNADQWFLTRRALSQRFPEAQVHWLKEATDVIPYLDACQQQKNNLPQMILVDLYLPSVQQGLHVLQALKSHPLYKSLPTVTLSWSNQVEDIARVFDNLADGYLVKPTDFQDWLAEFGLLDRYWT